MTSSETNANVQGRCISPLRRERSERKYQKLFSIGGQKANDVVYQSDLPVELKLQPSVNGGDFVRSTPDSFYQLAASKEIVTRIMPPDGMGGKVP
jgi:hypothetical protein